MEKFPGSTPRREEKVSDDVKFNTQAYRENIRAIEYHAAGSLDYFYQNKGEVVRQMFGKLSIDDIPETDFCDIENYITYISTRLATGAVSSKVFHEEVEAGHPLKALGAYNPNTFIGHDSIHAMFSYAQSQGSSLRPAYMKVAKETIIDNSRNSSSIDDDANLQEHYVEAFTLPGIFLEPTCKDLIAGGFSGEELAQELIARWKTKIASDTSRKFYMRDEEYATEHALPEFIHYMQAYAKAYERGGNPYIALREFQKILHPLLARLKQKQQHTDSEGAPS